MLELMNGVSAQVRSLVGLVLGATLLVNPAKVSALSCVGVSDRFFAECKPNECQIAFRARDIPISGSGGCARRTLVEDPQADISAVLFTKAAQRLAPGKYEITLVHRYYGAPPVTGEQLGRALEVLELKTPRVRVNRLPDDANLKDLRKEWDGRALSSLLGHLAYWGIEIVLLVGALFGVFRTVSVYRKRLFSPPPRRLLTPIAVQAALLVTAFFALASPTVPLLIRLVVPILLCVWAYELSVYLLAYVRRKTANEF